jgi:hypothetical protein
MFQNALNSVRQYVPHFWGESEIEDIRGSKSWKRAGWAYSGLMSNLLRTARFIIWYSTKSKVPRPGLYCPSWEVAAYAVVGMDHVRICKKPGCGALFIPRFFRVMEPVGPSDNSQKYCTQAHANADRVAKSKAKKRREEEKRKGKAARKSLR